MESWGYARVSGAEQQLDKGALQKQIQRLKSAGCSKVYWDIQSRTTEIRDGLQQLIHDLKMLPPGGVRSLIFTRIDRIGSSSRLFYSLLEVLRSKGIKLVALDQGVDPDSLGGELTIDMLLAAAKFEVRMVTERLKSERKQRIAQGKSHRVAPLGYRVKNDKYVRDLSPCVCLIEGKLELTASDLARRIFDTFFTCGSVAATVRKLHSDFGIQTKPLIVESKNLSHVINDSDQVDAVKFVTSSSRSTRWPYSGLKWSIPGLKLLLVNPVYAGGTPFETVVQKGKRLPFDEWKVAWATHDDEAIVTHEEHERVKQIIRSNRNNRWASSTADDINPYSNLIKCAKCGGSMTRHAKQRTNSYYQCRLYKSGNCDNKIMISSKLLDEQLITILIAESKRLADLVKTDTQKEIEPPEVRSLRASLNALEALPLNPAIEQAKIGILEQIAILSGSTNNNSKRSLAVKEEIIEAFSDDSYWKELTPYEKRVVLSGCIKRFFVTGRTISSIEYYY